MLEDKNSITYLLQGRADVRLKSWNSKASALHVAAYRGNSDIVQALVYRGVEVNEEDKHGDTLIGGACRGNHPNIVKFLVTQGALLDSKAYSDGPMLCYAARRGMMAMVEALASEGVDLNATGIDGETALELASKHDHQDVANFLRLGDSYSFEEIIECGKINT